MSEEKKERLGLTSVVAHKSAEGHRGTTLVSIFLVGVVNPKIHCGLTLGIGNEPAKPQVVWLREALERIFGRMNDGYVADSFLKFNGYMHLFNLMQARGVKEDPISTGILGFKCHVWRSEDILWFK